MISGVPAAFDGRTVNPRHGRRAAGWVALLVATLAAGCVQTVVVNDDLNDAASPDTVSAKDATGAADASGPADASGTSGDANCTSRSQAFYYERPVRVVIELDRSATMLEPFTNTTRAAAVQSVLNTAVSSQRHILFGLEQFPASSGSGGGGSGGTSCASTTCCAGAVTSDPSIISNSINCSNGHGSGCWYPGTDSPSHAALQVASEYVRNYWKQSNPEQYVLLFTASEPTCTGQDVSSLCETARRAVNDLSNSGVHVHVFFVGDKSGCLADLAQSGALVLHTPGNTYDLQNQVDGVLSPAAKAACTLTPWQAPPPDATKVEVYSGRDDIVSPGGWSLSNNNTTLTLSGQACDRYLASGSNGLQVLYSTCTP